MDMQRPRAGQATVGKRIIPSQRIERVRDRIMRTASELFYRKGIHAVGVDEIASTAGSNKMSFYRNFASKDELVAEYLRVQEQEAWQWWDATVASHRANPRAQVETLFGVLVEKCFTSGTRGCALANAAVEITESSHPARPIIEKYKAEMRRRFRAIAHDLGAREPDALGDSLMLLWEGSYMSRLTIAGRRGPSEAAAGAARALITAHTE
jgi:AcrR family transcriptional regulator